MPSLIRYFIGGDGRTFAEVVDARPSWLRRVRALDFVSVLTDGTYLETANTTLPTVPPHPDSPDLLRLLSVPGASVRDLHKRHLEFVEQNSALGENPPLEFEPDEYLSVGNYMHQLFSWKRRLGNGIQSEPPTLAKVETAWQAEMAV